MTPQAFREVRQYQLALVLVGLCLAGVKEREKILGRLSVFAVKSERSKRVLTAIRDQDVEGVEAFFATLGVHRQDGESFTDAILRRLDQLHGQMELESAARAVVFGDIFDLDTAVDRLDALRGILTEQKRRTFDTVQ